MQRIMLKSKIHRATLTAKALDYEGSMAQEPAFHKATFNNGAYLKPHP
jgi:aspartate 1-decarboxylase